MKAHKSYYYLFLILTAICSFSISFTLSTLIIIAQNQKDKEEKSWQSVKAHGQCEVFDPITNIPSISSVEVIKVIKENDMVRIDLPDSQLVPLITLFSIQYKYTNLDHHQEFTIDDPSLPIIHTFHINLNFDKDRNPLYIGVIHTSLLSGDPEKLANEHPEYSNYLSSFPSDNIRNLSFEGNF